VRQLCEQQPQFPRSSSTAPRPTEHNTSIVPVQVRQQIASASNAILRQEGLLSIPPSVDHDVPLVSAKNPVSSSLAPVNIAYNNCVFNIGNQTVNTDNSAARKDVERLYLTQIQIKLN
jgi:hypothetical protein